MEEGITPGYGDTVSLTQALDGFEFLLDFRQGFMGPLDVFVVAALTGKVTLGGNFQPENTVIGKGPGQAVIILGI
jgi:hypothetical protein